MLTYWIVVGNVYQSDAKERFYLNSRREFDVAYAALRHLVGEAKFANQSEPIQSDIVLLGRNILVLPSFAIV